MADDEKRESKIEKGRAAKPPPAPSTPEDHDLHRFLDEHFDEHDWPSRLLLCQLHGRGERSRPGPPIRTKVWLPTEKSSPSRPSKSDIVIMTNEIVAAARQHAHTVGANCRFIVQLENIRKGAGPYATHPFRVEYGALVRSGQAPEADTGESGFPDGESVKYLVKSVEMAQAHLQEMTEQMFERDGQMQFLMLKMMQTFAGHSDNLMAKNAELNARLEKMAESAAERDIKREWAMLEIETVRGLKDGVGRYFPLLANGIANRKIVPVQEGAEQIIAKNFLGAFPENDPKTKWAFGPNEDGKGGFFSEDEAKLLFLLATGKASDPKAVVRALREGFFKDGSPNMERIQEIMQHLEQDHWMPVLAFFRQSAEFDQQLAAKSGG